MVTIAGIYVTAAINVGPKPKGLLIFGTIKQYIHGNDDGVVMHCTCVCFNIV